MARYPNKISDQLPCHLDQAYQLAYPMAYQMAHEDASVYEHK